MQLVEIVLYLKRVIIYITFGYRYILYIVYGEDRNKAISARSQTAVFEITDFIQRKL